VELFTVTNRGFDDSEGGAFLGLSLKTLELLVFTRMAMCNQLNHNCP
jgi:hypothetical protein